MVSNKYYYYAECENFLSSHAFCGINSNFVFALEPKVVATVFKYPFKSHEQSHIYYI